MEAVVGPGAAVADARDERGVVFGQAHAMLTLEPSELLGGEGRAELVVVGASTEALEAGVVGGGRVP
jgi:hypothetical protein